MKKAVLTAVMAACFIWAATAALFTGLRLAIADESWFLDFYTEYGTYERFGISPEDSARAIAAMIDYMEGDRESIQLTVTEFGSEVEMFNEQEIVHMVDVRELYGFFGRLSAFSPVALVLIALLARVSGEPGRALRRSLTAAAAVTLIAAAVLGIWVAVDFSSFWVSFHHAFFTNELWLMDYATCRMIRICPESIFFSIVVRMGLFTALIIAAAAGAAAAAYRVIKWRKGAKRA